MTARVSHCSPWERRPSAASRSSFSASSRPSVGRTGACGKLSPDLSALAAASPGRLGDRAGSSADIAAARASRASVANLYTRQGITP